jgi:fibronectin type 3 domain-containing protein
MKYLHYWAVFLAVTIGLLTAAPMRTWAQGNSGPVVVPDSQHGLSSRLGDTQGSPTQNGLQQEIPLRRPNPPMAPPLVQNDPVVQSSPGPSASATSRKIITGVGANGYAPPDTNGAAGATQYVQWVNVRFAVFDKATGNLQYGPVAGNTLWQSGLPGSACANNNSGDPIAQYDKQAGRWVMLQPVFTSPYYLCVAVSTTSDALGSYNLYQFPIPSNYFPDYPKLGVWPDGYYVSYNAFTNLFAGAWACALDRTHMLSGQPATMQCFNSGYASLLPSDLDGASGAAGSTAAPPGGSPSYFVDFTANAVHIWKFHADFTTPANTTFNGPVTVSVAAFNEACNGGTCIPQSGTTTQLDSLGDRMMYRAAYRNFGDHEAIVLTHSVANTSGVAGVRWYEIRSPGSGPTVFQQGTYLPDSTYRWMGSIAQDKVGDIAVGYSVSSSLIHPGIRYTGRTPSDPAGTMEAETSIVEGPGSQTNNLHRWGDYSAMSVDPSDDCTFWYTSEYLPANGSFNWSTAIASFSFPGCATPTAPSAPTNLVATAGNNQDSLTWNASTGATSYTVQRGTISGSYDTTFSGISNPSYIDTTAKNTITYYYVVEAVNSVGTSGPSNEATATPTCSAPGTPTGLSATAGNAQVVLTWAATAGASSYSLKRAPSGGLIDTTYSGITSTTYTDTAVSNGTTYNYVVSATNACGTSADSAPVSATPQAPTATAPPSNLKATNPGSSGKVNLSWTQSTSAGITGNKVYRSTTSGGPYSLVATLSATTSYSDSANLTRGTTYFYVVTAVSSGGESGNSNQASVKVR